MGFFERVSTVMHRAVRMVHNFLKFQFGFLQVPIFIESFNSAVLEI